MLANYFSSVSTRKILSKLKVDKSPGPDNMHPCFLGETANKLAIPLNVIFNKSLESSDILDEWKKGTISALFKKGNKNDQ